MADDQKESMPIAAAKAVQAKGEMNERKIRSLREEI